MELKSRPAGRFAVELKAGRPVRRYKRKNRTRGSLHSLHTLRGGASPAPRWAAPAAAASESLDSDPPRTSARPEPPQRVRRGRVPLDGPSPISESSATGVQQLLRQLQQQQQMDSQLESIRGSFAIPRNRNVPPQGVCGGRPLPPGGVAAASRARARSFFLQSIPTYSGCPAENPSRFSDYRRPQAGCLPLLSFQ